MAATRDAQAILDRDFLEIRHDLINVAAALDRIARATGGDQVRSDDRMAKIDQALQALRDPGDTRSERVQQIFSREYDPDWKK